MIVQSMIFPSRVCNSRELYIRSSGEARIHTGYINIGKGATLRTDSYMNVFDAGTWLRYTGITEWMLQLCISGKGKIRLIHWKGDNSYPVLCIPFHSDHPQTVIILFEHYEQNGMYYFEIEAESETLLSNAFYASKKIRQQRDIRLGLIICTYHRKEALGRNLQEIKASRFFDESDELYGKLQTYVIDNGSELPLRKDDFINYYHNPNTGGSGGFTRGIEEMRRDESTCGFTHAIFMDDDVEILSETFYRLYALLSLVREEYRMEAVTGRMFRMDKRQVQYTAAEIWNGGDIRHIGWNLDMTEEKNLPEMNNNQGAEYGGWWFACFPIGFVLENTPLPFFLHCDDVEYGLRHGGTPIILNGIQVWHETYEHRQSPVIAYYDMRNSLIVNELYGGVVAKEKILAEWKRKITEQHVKRDYLMERMLILGMWDYCKGIEWLEHMDSVKKQIHLKRKKKCSKIGNSILWRLAKVRMVYFYKT